MNRPHERRRVELLTERILSIGATLAVLYWAWLITGQELWVPGRLRPASWTAMLVPTTALLLLGAIGALWIRPTSGRMVFRLLLIASALFWLSGFYGTIRGPRAQFPTPPSMLHRSLLALSVCFVGVLFLNWSMTLAENNPKLWRRAVFGIGMLITLGFTADLFMSTEPPTPINIPSELYRTQYHPVFTYRPEGSYVQSPEQERVVADFRGVKFAQQKPDGIQRIVLNGASTMWGHMLDASDCLRARIEARLRERFPDRKWEVLCIAYPGKYQLNELVDSTVTLPHWKPDLIVSFNGYNEVWYSENRSIYVGMPHIEDQATFGSLEATLMRYTHSGQWVASMARSRKRFEAKRYKVDLSGPPRYYSHLRLTARTLRSCGIRYAYCFCPNAYEVHAGNRARTRHASRSGTRRGQGAGRTGGEEYLELESETRGLVSQLTFAGSEPKLPELMVRRRKSAEIVCEEGQISFDATECLLNQSAPVFFDPCHLNRLGTQVIAEQIANAIPQWLAGRLH